MKKVNLQTLEKILKQAATAPTGDNCQPWRFAWDGSKLTVFHDEQRAVHSLNRNNHASLLSLGCLSKLLSLSAKQHGHESTLTLLPDAGTERREWASVTLKEGAKAEPLANVISLRHTDRRPYKGGSVEHPIFSTIVGAAEQCRQTKVHVISKYSSELLNYLGGLDGFIWTDQKLQADVMRWIRFSATEMEGTLDGMPWQTLGVSYLESRLLEKCRSWSVQKVFNRSGFVWNMKKMVQKHIRSSAALLLFTSTRTDASALVEAGELFCESWLHLNGAGYGVQPLTLGSLGIFDSVTLALKENEEPNFAKLVAPGRKILTDAFSLSATEIPVWMMRTGVSEALPESHRSKRLPVEKLLTVTKKTA